MEATLEHLDVIAVVESECHRNRLESAAVAYPDFGIATRTTLAVGDRAAVVAVSTRVRVVTVKATRCEAHRLHRDAHRVIPPGRYDGQVRGHPGFQQQFGIRD